MTKPSAPRRMRRAISTAALSVARDEWIEEIAEEILTETRPEDRDNRWFDSVRTETGRKDGAE